MKIGRLYVKWLPSDRAIYTLKKPLRSDFNRTKLRFMLAMAQQTGDDAFRVLRRR